MPAWDEENYAGQVVVLKHKCTELEAERDRLKTQLEDMRARKVQATEERDDMKAYLDAQLAMGRKEIKALTDERDRYRKALEELLEWCEPLPMNWKESPALANAKRLLES